MINKPNAIELRKKLEVEYGYLLSDNEFECFFSNLIKVRKKQKKEKFLERMQLIEEGFEEGGFEEGFIGEKQLIRECNSKKLYITYSLLRTLIKSLEKYYKPYFKPEDFNRLILAAILQFENIHCCVIKSEGPNNASEMANGKPTKDIPYQILVISKNGFVKHTDAYGRPLMNVSV